MMLFHGVFLAALMVTSCGAFTVSFPSKVKTKALKMNILSDLLGSLGKKTFPAPCVMGDEGIMSPKAHGTSNTPVQGNLRWNCDHDTADRICNFNRHYAEYSGYWKTTSFVQEAMKEYEANGEVKFYDSNTGKLLFVAPKGRSMDDFLKESSSHGWPSFRDDETVWENVRCLPNGEAVSVDGTHLGHNLPDFSGSRYCINLVSVAGRPMEGGASE
jgi:peptide methionine sulfoxide reductase MsrB